MAAINPSAAPKMRSLLVQNSLFTCDQIDLTLNHIHDEIAFMTSILCLKPKFLDLFSNPKTAKQIRTALLRNIEDKNLVIGVLSALITLESLLTSGELSALLRIYCVMIAIYDMAPSQEVSRVKSCYLSLLIC